VKEDAVMAEIKHIPKLVAPEGFVISATHDRLVSRTQGDADQRRQHERNVELAEEIRIHGKPDAHR
jgi:hypothetical protein